MNIEQYYNRLADHDWFHSFSDDHGVWRRGASNERELEIIAKQNPTFERMYNDFCHTRGKMLDRQNFKWPKLEDYQEAE